MFGGFFISEFVYWRFPLLRSQRERLGVCCVVKCCHRRPSNRDVTDKTRLE